MVRLAAMMRYGRLVDWQLTVLFVPAFARPFLHEPLMQIHWTGAVLIVSGAIVHAIKYFASERVFAGLFL
jgi:drug/metabolite transporter (DMT)-like permease